MSVNLIPEERLRVALRPYRVDVDAFAAGVRDKLTAKAAIQRDPFARLSPLLRGAAAFLPLDILAPAPMAVAAAKLAPATGVYKFIGYIAFPAISLFLLLGATVFSFAKVRNIQNKRTPLQPINEAELIQTTNRWWSEHFNSNMLIYTAAIAIAWFGGTWLLFLIFIISLGCLVYLLSRLAKIGLGNRLLVGQSCLFALMMLAQIFLIPGMGEGGIHFIDQKVTASVFFLGALVLAIIVGKLNRHVWAQMRLSKTTQFTGLGMFVGGMTLMSAWFMHPILWPATPARITRYVESFDWAPFSSSSWSMWEIVAAWTVDTGRDPDLTRPRQLLARELANQDNRMIPFILSSAFRVGLVRPDQLDHLPEYEHQRNRILADAPSTRASRPLTSLNQMDWVIRAAVMRDDLTGEQRDLLESRLKATLDTISSDKPLDIDTPLRATQLLAVIGRPVEPQQYRERMHDLLRSLHDTRGNGFDSAGGFNEYTAKYFLRAGSLRGTVSAVGLMEIYGVPDDLNINWVRSFLKPTFLRLSPQKWMAAVTLDRVNRLPGVAKPSWWEMVYYERSLLAACVLVALCIYATLSSPVLKPYPAGS